MNDVTLLGHQIRYEQKSYWRNPQSAFFTFAFPIMFLVIFASLNKGERLKDLGNISFNQYYIPAIIAFGVMSACYTSLAIGLANRRESGILKRLRGTPLPVWTYFAGLVVNSVIVSVLLGVLTVGVGVAFYSVHLPYHLAPLLLALILGAATFCALGVAVSTLAPNAEAAPAIVQFPFFALVFISGTFFPAPKGSFISHLAGYFPLVHFTNAVFAPFNPLATGNGFAGHDLLILGLWALGASAVAIRRFRWEPRRG
ncbi:MAG: ABC transporter permease [Frankiaceae bacterium]|jgi:ABC-2 type transport system permease protein